MTAWGLRSSQYNRDPILLMAKCSTLHKALDFRNSCILEQRHKKQIVTPPPQMSLSWPKTEDSSQYSQRIADVSLDRGSEGPLWTAWVLQTFCVADGLLQNMHGSIQRRLNTYSVLSCFLNTKMNRSHSLSPRTLQHTRGDNTHN